MLSQEAAELGKGQEVCLDQQSCKNVIYKTWTFMIVPFAIPLLQIVFFLQDLPWPESTKAPGLTSHTAQNPQRFEFFTT